MRTILAAAAAMAAAGWAVASAPAGGAVTPQCGSGCVALYNLVHGKSDVIGVLDANGAEAHQGQLTVMRPVISTSQAEDWVADARDTVHNFYLDGLLSAGIDKHYGKDEVYEYQYAPWGRESGFCLGVPAPAAIGTVVSLQPCGADARTLWIRDANDQYKRHSPLIAGTDANFIYPLVLTADATGGNLRVTLLTGGTGSIDNGQYWGTGSGVSIHR